MNQFDVIIIGGGPAGSTAATFIAQKGHSVLLLEKEKFPREHIGESLIPASYHVLKKLNVLEDLKKISPRKPGVSFVAHDGKSQSLWCFKNVVKNESYLSFHVKRSAFDKLLLDNSKANGATVLEQHAVKQVELDNPDGSVSVRVADEAGNAKSFTGKILIDASGQSTFLGSKLGVKKPVKDLDRVAVWSHWTGATYDEALIQGAIKIVYLGGEEKKGWIWVIPISKDNLSIGVVLNNSYLKSEKERIQGEGIEDWKNELYKNEIKSSLAVHTLLETAHMDHKVQVNGDYSYSCEKKYGTNFAMIGDAGAFLDPIFSSGIFVGMHSAELVAGAVHEKLTLNSTKLLDEVYEDINGAVRLLEKFIKLFYSPEIINFSLLGHPEDLLQFKVSESIYTIFHFLLSGDFFKNHEKYSDFIDTMKDQKMVAKFQHLINYSKDNSSNATCGEVFEEMYGDMTYDIEFNQKEFS